MHFVICLLYNCQTNLLVPATMKNDAGFDLSRVFHANLPRFSGSISAPLMNPINSIANGNGKLQGKRDAKSKSKSKKDAVFQSPIHLFATETHISSPIFFKKKRSLFALQTII